MCIQFIHCEVCNDIQWVEPSPDLLAPADRSPLLFPPQTTLDADDDIIFTGCNPAPPRIAPPDIVFISSSHQRPKAATSRPPPALPQPVVLPSASEPFRSAAHPQHPPSHCCLRLPCISKSLFHALRPQLQLVRAFNRLPCSVSRVLAQAERQRAAYSAPPVTRTSSDCPICQDEMTELASLGCGHVFCFACIQSTSIPLPALLFVSVSTSRSCALNPLSLGCLKDQGKQANCPICRSTPCPYATYSSSHSQSTIAKWTTSAVRTSGAT